MYTAVRTHDYEYPESEMDDRESLYFDTISLADSEAAAAAAAHRKSLSQSRNTIYHSAVDLIGEETPPKRNSGHRVENSVRNIALRNTWSPSFRHSTAYPLENLTEAHNGDDGDRMDCTDAAIASQIVALHNGGGDYSGYSRMHLNAYNDERTRRLLTQSGSSSNKDKKMPITYSQWKSRTRRRFQDGVRSVDFVLAYRGDDHKLENLKKREIFEANLLKEGLHLEHDNTQRIHFVKLHAPLEVLCHYSEVLKIKLPIKKIPGEDQLIKDGFDFQRELNGCWAHLCPSIKLNPEKFPPREQRIHCEFSRTYEHLFDWKQPNFFDAGTRNYIINFLLERQHFVEGDETPDNLGIEKLLEDGVYESAYTLHDDTDRDLLLSEWANLKKWKNLQPFDNIKEYFGPKVALYFAWLGFYTHMLIPASIAGIICFLYGIISLSSDPISKQICNTNATTLMCPQCDRSCDFWKLQETCNSSKINYLIDNNVTVLFAFFMAVWAVLYLELWKRHSACLVHRWGLVDFSQHVEHPRPQYLAKIRDRKVFDGEKYSYTNYVLDPDVPFWTTKFLSNFTSYGIVILFICISLIAIFSVVIYRMAQKASHNILGNENSMTYKIMVLPMTAGIIDLIVISILDYAYSYLAVYLTNLEYCRTRTEYDESLTIKNYIFQFVNYYSSLLYIAFVKGKFVGYPAKYNRVLGFRQEECNPGGCLMELCMQLVIIMVGKQAINAIVEMLIPYISHKIKVLGTHFGIRKRDSEEKLVSCNQWTEDYHLTPWTHTSMFSEYLEMVLQFGFITLFGLAFPLAPFLALINNLIEVRLDAIKMLRLLRRPVAQRARNIGVWSNILTILTKISVASSAVIIAFSTNLIPKFVYRATTKDESLEGYLNFTLAHFHTKDFQVQPTLMDSPYENVTACRYTEFRNPPWSENPYKRPMIYWIILTARLAFIVIFQNVIGIIQTMVAWAIPDTPGKLRKRIKREGFLLREHIIEMGKKLIANKAGSHATAGYLIASEQMGTNVMNSNKLNDDRTGGRGGGDNTIAKGEEVVLLRKSQSAPHQTTETGYNEQTTTM